MQRFFDFLDHHPRLCVSGAVFFGVLALALDASTFCPF